MVLYFSMSETNTQTSSNLKTTVPVNDAVFLKFTRKEVLSIIK